MEKLASQTTDQTPVSVQDRISFRLQRLSTLLTTQATQILKESSGLTINQWRLMSFVAEKNSASVADIVKVGELDKATMSRCCNTLVSKGYIVTEVSKTDQRRANLRLTAKGTAALAKAEPWMHQRQTVLFDALSTTEQDQLFRILDKLDMAAAQRIGVNS